MLSMLLACGGPSEKNKNKEELSSPAGEAPKTENYSSASSPEPDREGFSKMLDGLWYDSEYIKMIQTTYSVLEAGREAETVISCGFDKEALMGDNPYAGGASAHEGGYMARLTWDEKGNYFKSASVDQNSLTDEPFKIIFNTDQEISLKSMDGRTIQTFKKVEMPDALNNILLAGSYKMEDGTNISFTPKGEIKGHPKYEGYGYEIVEDFFDIHMDQVRVVNPDRKTQVFHYEVVEDGFVLYEITGSMGEGFHRGSFVNKFTSLDGRKNLITDVEEDNISVKTNYFDLPEDEIETLKKILKDDDLEVVEGASIKTMKDYLKKTVFGGRSPFGPGLKSAYFWNVYNALPEFVAKKERHQGYYSGQNESNFREKLIAYSIYRLDRSPENVKKLFDYAKPVLMEIFPPTSYERSGIDRKLKQLINSYKMLSEIDGYAQKLSDTYTALDTMTGKFINVDGQEVFRKFENSAYGFSVYDLNEFIMKKLNPDMDRFQSIPAGLSFWMRRNYEGNMDEVYSILREIDEIYSR
ncbi:hypothetical protein DDZ16_17645 [Marinilabilia rubra]|uniref:Uncharacterized protein n=2 Tax=Marinilabilia rubra TaxID=2162893 RepID=A0A2U2B4Q9_9BACT|nr:hypothetical protein DDZ16_17645 [Marinilabilia rubra]